MKFIKRFSLLAFVLLITLSCQAVTGLFHPPVTPLPTVTSTAAVTLTPIPETPIPSATYTRVPLTFTPAPTATLPALLTKERLEIFEKLWQIINDNYLYADFNGVDWKAIHEEYYPKVVAAKDSETFYALLNQMIGLLNDEHSGFLNPRDAEQEETEFAGENNFTGIGILTQAVYERGCATVLLTFPGSPAEKAGIKPHDNIFTVDGEPVIQDDELMIKLIQGAENTQVTIEVQTPGEEMRQLTLTRKRISDSTPVPYQVLNTPEGKRVGYIMLVTFADITIDSQVGDALEKMTADGPLDGVILDNRMNAGGADTVAKGTLGYFTSGVLGHFVDRDNRQRQFSVTATDINGSQKIPLVVLVGKGTASFGELFAGTLKDSGRAYIIGETTEGNVELLRGYDFEDGSRAWIAHEKFQPINHPQDNWEITGIIPDLTVISAWDQVTTETDPVILSSLEYFDSK